MPANNISGLLSVTYMIFLMFGVLTGFWREGRFQPATAAWLFCSRRRACSIKSAISKGRTR